MINLDSTQKLSSTVVGYTTVQYSSFKSFSNCPFEFTYLKELRRIFFADPRSQVV